MTKRYRDTTAVEHDEVYDFMNQNLVYYLDGDGELLINNMMKEAYEKFGGSLDLIKEHAHAIKAMYEGGTK